MTEQEIKQAMVSLIKSHGLPVCASRCEADGSYGILVDGDESLWLGGYALEGDIGETLDDLDIYDLAMLIQHGTRDAKEIAEFRASEEEDVVEHKGRIRDSLE